MNRATEEGKAEEIAARTVSKQRARTGEAEESSRTPVKDISSGGVVFDSHIGPGGRTYDGEPEPRAWI